MDKFQFMIRFEPFTNLKNLKRAVAFSFFKFLIEHNGLITKCFSEAKRRGFSFDGYVDPEDKKYRYKRKEVQIQQGTVNPIKLKHNR